MRKKCTRCNKEKNDEDFAFRNKTKGLKKYSCKICDKKIRKTHYVNNKKKIISSVKINNEISRNRNRQFVWDYLKKHPCVECGNNNPLVLDFDHIESETKNNTISHLIHNCYSVDKIIEEINKCNVMCANCHRIRTAIQFGYYKDIIK